MSINHIETEDLRRMEGKGGLILQGCGGDPVGIVGVDLSKDSESDRRF